MSKMSKIYKFYSMVAVYCLALWVIGLGPSEVAEAATIHVPKDYSTIQKALDAASRGDKIVVSEGIYYENVTLKAGVILEGGWNKDYSRREISTYVTTIDGKNKAGWVVLGADDAVLDGFTIINGKPSTVGDSTTGAGVHCKSTSPTIVNNVIKGNEPAGVYCNKSSATIMNNTISDNKEAGIYIDNGSSLKIKGNTIYNNKMAGIGTGDLPASQVEIRNNIIHNNGRAGIDVAAATGTIHNNIIYENNEAGVRCVITPVEVINNTIVANRLSGILEQDPSVTPLIKNNIIANNGDTGIRSAGKGYSYNLLFSNNHTEDCNPVYLWCVRRQFGSYENEESYLESHNIIADPMFVDGAGHDYHLLFSSPAIDAGDPDSKYNDVNFDPSLGEDLNDMGAYGGPLTIAEKRKKNDPPLASPGPAQEVFAGDRVTLNGRGSSDPNGDIISYQWEFVTKPKTSKAKLSHPDRSKLIFKADAPGEYVVQLTVKDRWGKLSDPQIVTINALVNHPPVAKAGEIITQIYPGDLVTLFGGVSRDKDGDPLTYRWELTFKPSQSRATLTDKTTVSPSFVVDALGCYTAQLIVNDRKSDSAPDTMLVCTSHAAEDGKRHVPEQYPTIQSAIDAAEPGDDIVVQKGTYKERVIVDKSVDLIGVDWPVIDGGTKEGDFETVLIPYLGDTAGKIEGFVITGGGTGSFGHGLKIWDSAPEIVNNKIAKNGHVGVGIHGKGQLTAKTKIHDNLIYDNMVGVGNGRGGNGYIYNNHIYNNAIVGVGSRGLATPKIEDNYIYGNHVGIGTREVASPYIAGNHIYENAYGIAISPMSTVKRFEGDEVIIKNNLIFNNYQNGIFISSFNLNKIIITNNTIDSNNHEYAYEDRGGGVVFGYPHPASFTAVMENNIITNNKNGVVNYIGDELFPAPGATIEGNYNNVWNNGSDYTEGVAAGSGSFSKDPLFASVASEKNGNYFLSQSASGQDSNSPCVDVGSREASQADLGNFSTRVDKKSDTGKVDLGYHYH